MSYIKTGWVNDLTELSAENMNHMEEGIEQAYGQILLAVDSVEPEECNTGDRYYNIEDNLIYTAIERNIWGGNGVAPEYGVFYIVLDDQTIYTYNGETLISVGGGAGGGDSAPIGQVSMYAGSTAPDGFLMCDGSAVSRETYKDLYRVIGTTYGVGDGSTTFNLPDIKGKVVVMLDTNDTDFDTLGETGGSKYLQEHIHDNLKWYDVSASADDGTGAYKLPITFNAGNSNTATNYHTGNVNSSTQTGNSGNLQPYIVLNYIIKVQKLAGEVLSEQLPVGTEIDFDGSVSDIPIGWEQVESYSTNEVKTGDTWVDNKPIYRKTYLLSNVTSALSNIDVTSLNIDKIINLYGMSYNNSLQIPVNFYNTGNFNQCYYSSNIKAIQYQFNFGSDAYIIIEYTKTTD